MILNLQAQKILEILQDGGKHCPIDWKYADGPKTPQIRFQRSNTTSPAPNSRILRAILLNSPYKTLSFLTNIYLMNYD